MDVPPDVTEIISQALGALIESKSATFACGGSVAISHTEASVGATNPVVLRWDSPALFNNIVKLQFPIICSDEEATNSLARLQNSCQPASFGHNGEDILDETYRKATKLDRSAFSVDFCPYEVGIIDTIAQMLLPDSNHKSGMSGVRAELYKLNIYAAPSGFFKPHVDTPRASSQFGSLVVSLPCYHMGGQLVVRHAGYSHFFDWSTDVGELPNSAAIQWAAFYSDCEHEVLEVIDGHRITLTYNLYHTLGVGELAGRNGVMDTGSIPLLQHVQVALKRDEFMPAGGHLGIFCQHAYAHTNSSSARALPGNLKGADMAVYNVFRALGLDIQVRAILDTESEAFMEHYENCAENADHDEYGDYEEFNPAFRSQAVVGRLGGRLPSEIGGGEEDMEEVVNEWSRDWKKVVWVNNPRWRETDMVHMTYGNQAGIGCLYSYAAMLVKVPSAAQRGAPGIKSEPIFID